ncbi:hypothetical protein BJP34_31965 [Moorena producens PAL-8-15-08-1]|uniref:Uncharacterized protein n=1 Tax=Moorena producens PAL-8-15-08-1 TaxID=1458985 RepID=A0A1D8U0U2_9CYAN|nr:hypothetical protein [Moorena producens]AOX03443.1 hypothetical protein BJP34_31965 [Moorena producens PAL-8-15-08-1]
MLSRQQQDRLPVISPILPGLSQSDLTEILHHCHCLDAVAHGGNPQDRAASLIVGWAVRTKALCKLHYLSGALPTLHELVRDCLISGQSN